MDIISQYIQEIGWEIFFDSAGIEIPFPHQTLYFGEASKPIEVALLKKLKGKNHS